MHFLNILNAFQSTFQVFGLFLMHFASFTAVYMYVFMVTTEISFTIYVSRRDQLTDRRRSAVIQVPCVWLCVLRSAWMIVFHHIIFFLQYILVFNIFNLVFNSIKKCYKTVFLCRFLQLKNIFFAQITNTPATLEQKM